MAMNAGPLAVLLLLGLLFGSRRRDGTDAARAALNASDAEARRPDFTDTSSPRGRVILPGLEDIEQTEGRAAPGTPATTRSTPATATAAARRDLCRIDASGLALSGSGADSVVREWLRCQGRTRAQAQALIARLDDRRRSGTVAAPARAEAQRLWQLATRELADLERAGVIVAGVGDGPVWEPVIARQMSGPLSRSLRNATQHGPRDDVADFQLAAGLPSDGLYSPATREALRHFGVRSPPPAWVAGPAEYTPPRRRRAA